MPKDASAAALADPQEEVAALVRTLHETQERLQELAGGEVDAVVHPGHSYLLHQAQEKLRRSEAAQRDFAATQASILNALPAHVALINRDGVILTVNDRWRQFAEAKGVQNSSSDVGDNYVEVCEQARGAGSEDAHQTAAGIRAVLAGTSGEFSLEYPCHAPHEHRWFRLMVSRLDQASPGGAVVMHINVTERRLAEAAVRDSQANMAAAQRIAHFGSWDLDLIHLGRADVDANPLRWSDEMFRIAGYEPGEVTVSNEWFFRHVPAEEHEAIREAVATAVREGGQYSVVHRFLRPNGEERLLHEVAQIFRDEQTGQPLKMIGTALDITERRQEQAALRESEAEFRTLAEAMPQIVWITRPDGWNTYLSPQWTDYTGLTQEESRGHGWNRPFHPDDQQRARRLGSRRRRRPALTRWNAACAARTGRIGGGWFVGSPAGRGGNPPQVVWHVHGYS